MDLAKNLKIESVDRLTPSKPVVLKPQDTVADAVRQMQERRIGCVVICLDRPVLGIFTERDLINRVLTPGRSLDLPLSSVMTPEPMTVQRKEPIAQAMKRMQKGGYRHLPVVDENGRPVGMLSIKRIVHYIVEHYPFVANVPPTPDPFFQVREGA